MPLSDLAALGSFASGIAVVISLISLTVQLRQNTRATMRAEANAAQEQVSNWRLTVANSADLASIWNKGVLDADLNEIEDVRYSFLLQDLTFAVFQVWDRSNMGMQSKDAWKRVSRRIATGLATRRGAAWWERNRETFQAEFAAEIDAAIRDIRATGLSVAGWRPAAVSNDQLTNEGKN